MEAVFGRPRVHTDQHGCDLRYVSHCVALTCPLRQCVLQDAAEDNKRAQVEYCQVLDPHELVMLCVDPSLLCDQLLPQNEKDTCSQHQLEGYVDCFDRSTLLPALVLCHLTLKEAHEDCGCHLCCENDRNADQEGQFSPAELGPLYFELVERVLRLKFDELSVGHPLEALVTARCMQGITNFVHQRFQPFDRIGGCFEITER